MRKIPYAWLLVFIFSFALPPQYFFAQNAAKAKKSKIPADLMVFNAKIYTVNEKMDVAEAMAIKNGRIIAVGTAAKIRAQYQAKSQFDAQKRPIYPGFIDAHAHFYRYGEGLQTCELAGTRSWEEVLTRLKDFVAQKKLGADAWLVGRGWDQNDWAVKEFPTRAELDRLFPDRPVILSRVDGHAAICNQKALDIADLKPNQKLEGGEIETKNDALTGILIDNAIDLMSARVPQATEAQSRTALLDAQKNCFAVGLTSIADCGLDFPIVELMDKMNRENALKMRLYVMLSDDRKNYDYLFKRGIIKTDYLHVRSFKLYADGALGSRGACLLHPYADRANHFGFLLKNKDYFEAIMPRIAEKGFQACTHAIGDSANREILRIYGNVLKGKNDQRWRIEHAQVIDNEDFSRFGNFSIIPSVQPTHATSDMYWAGDRLGKKREVGAYAYKNLMQQNGWLPLGTDFPVEDINPLLTFCSAVFRQDAKGFPEGGYQMANALSREATLRGMTIWAAKAQFEDKEKGSLEVGKMADFIILDTDIMTESQEKIRRARVQATFVNGAKVF